MTYHEPYLQRNIYLNNQIASVNVNDIIKIDEYSSAAALFESDDEDMTRKLKMKKTHDSIFGTPFDYDQPVPQIAQIKSYMEPTKLLDKVVEVEMRDKTEDLPQKGAVAQDSSQNDSLTYESNTQKFKYYEDVATIGKIFDKDLFEQISQVDHIRKTEIQLEEMKVTIKDKKRLQKERNVLTAQLSRDRKKLEVELLR